MERKCPENPLGCSAKQTKPYLPGVLLRDIDVSGVKLACADFTINSVIIYIFINHILYKCSTTATFQNCPGTWTSKLLSPKLGLYQVSQWSPFLSQAGSSIRSLSMTAVIARLNVLHSRFQRTDSVVSCLKWIKLLDIYINHIRGQLYSLNSNGQLLTFRYV